MNDFRPTALEIRHLRLVTSIVDEGGLGRAAQRLNLTQSALSHQLKQIETSLGTPLFVRAKKRLVLTASGEELVLRARQIVADVGALEEDLRRRATGWRGTLRIAMECYTLYEWLPPVLQRFQRRHRNVDVQIAAEATTNVKDALLRGELDLAIVQSHAMTPSLALHPLFRDEVLLVVPGDHKLASKRHVVASDLASERLLLFNPPETSWVYQHLFARGGRPREVTVMKLTEAMLSMVRGGFGVMTAARWAVASELRSGKLAGVRIGADGYFREWFAATLPYRNRPLPPYMTEFIDLVSQSALPARFDERVPA